MAVPKKVTKKGAGVPKKTAVAKPTVTLPTEVSEPSEDLMDYVWLLYGEKKIGKTSLAARFPDALFFMFEPGGKALRIYQRPINRWAEFVSYLDLLDETEDFRTVVVDTADIAYDRCFEHMCTKLAITHPQDERDFGRSWQAIENEFTKQMTRLLNSDRGCIFIAHAETKEVETRTGEMFSVLQPSLAKQAGKFLEGVVDIQAYYGYMGNERRLLIQGNDFIKAGNRLEEHFHSPEGERIVSIPMGTSPAQAFANLNTAFDNEQDEIGGEMLDPSAGKSTGKEVGKDKAGAVKKTVVKKAARKQ